MSHDAGAVCLCRSEHAPAPLEYEAHHIWPLGMGGPDEADNLVWVCPTTHTNTHEILRLFVKAGAVLPFKTLTDMYTVPVSRYAYALASEGFTRWKKGTS